MAITYFLCLRIIYNHKLYIVIISVSEDILSIQITAGLQETLSLPLVRNWAQVSFWWSAKNVSRFWDCPTWGLISGCVKGEGARFPGLLSTLGEGVTYLSYDACDVPTLSVNRQTDVKTLPSHSFVCEWKILSVLKISNGTGLERLIRTRLIRTST